jgi:hypothetical protein
VRTVKPTGVLDHVPLHDRGSARKSVSRRASSNPFADIPSGREDQTLLAVGDRGELLLRVVSKRIWTALEPGDVVEGRPVEFLQSSRPSASGLRVASGMGGTRAVG